MRLTLPLHHLKIAAEPTEGPTHSPRSFCVPFPTPLGGVQSSINQIPLGGLGSKQKNVVWGSVDSVGSVATQPRSELRGISATRTKYEWNGICSRGRNMREKLREEALQRTSTAHMAQACQGFLLDLTYSLAGDTQQATDLLQRHRLLALESEVQSQDLGLALLEG